MPIDFMLIRLVEGTNVWYGKAMSLSTGIRYILSPYFLPYRLHRIQSRRTPYATFVSPEQTVMPESMDQMYTHDGKIKEFLCVYGLVHAF